MTTNPSCTVEVLEIRIKFVLFLKAQTPLICLDIKFSGWFSLIIVFEPFVHLQRAPK